MDLGFWVLLWIGCAIAGYVAAHSRSAGSGGLILGVLLGPIGVLAALGLDGRPLCPHCGGRLDGRGKKCQWCAIALVWHQSAEGWRAEAAAQAEAPPTGEQPKKLVIFDCGGCGKRLNAERGMARAMCPYCQALVDVPQG
ncbi:MAG: hypothetical protein AB7O62_00140 [Pirellulales bacterium]